MSERITTNMSLEGIRQQKKDLRREIRGRMKQISAEEIKTQSAQVWERVFALPQYQAAKSVGLFVSMPTGEIQTDVALNKVLLVDKKTLYVPRVGLDFEQCDMSLIKVHTESSSPGNTNQNQNGTMFYHDWLCNKWSIPEPPINDTNDEAKAGDIDLLIVPGCAFDSRGNRMGQGKGYYDRFIEKVTISGDKDGTPKRPLLLAVGLEAQFLGFAGNKDAAEESQLRGKSVPTHDHDMPMDILVFPHCTIDLITSGT
jgi:5-formyltetrahydrofolate cyclo-ligase